MAVIVFSVSVLSDVGKQVYVIYVMLFYLFTPHCKVSNHLVGQDVGKCSPVGGCVETFTHWSLASK